MFSKSRGSMHLGLLFFIALVCLLVWMVKSGIVYDVFHEYGSRFPREERHDHIFKSHQRVVPDQYYSGSAE